MNMNLRDVVLNVLEIEILGQTLDFGIADISTIDMSCSESA